MGAHCADRDVDRRDRGLRKLAQVRRTDAVGALPEYGDRSDTPSAGLELAEVFLGVRILGWVVSPSFSTHNWQSAQVVDFIEPKPKVFTTR